MPLIVPAIALSGALIFSAPLAISDLANCGVSTEMPQSSSADQGMLLVHVRLVGQGGAARADDRPRQPVDLGPAFEAIVRILALDGSGLEVEQVADDQGGLQISLPAGPYRIYVPRGEGEPWLRGAQPAGANLPDGRPVLGWADDVVSNGSTAEITLAIWIPLS